MLIIADFIPFDAQKNTNVQNPRSAETMQMN